MEFGLIMVIIIIVLAWIYDFYNGANDCANSIATTVSTRVLSPFKAVVLAAVLNFAGAFITTEVAKTIGKGIVSAEFITPALVMSATIGAVIWAAFATHRGIPVSISHCIVGGLIGAGLAGHGWQAINWVKMKSIIIGMVTSPVGGFILGFVLLLALMHIFRNWRPARANFLFGKAQLLSASFMALTHGMNDAQNAMGIITAALLAGGFIGAFEVPVWVIFGSAFFMGLGTLYGGSKVIRTMGMKLAKIKPIHGFSAETASSAVIFLASMLGIPISTTHVVSTAIMGVGSVRRFSAVRWGIAGHIVVTWILTVPAAAGASWLVYLILSRIIV